MAPRQGFVDLFELDGDFRRVLVHLQVDGGDFGLPDPFETPLADDHLFDKCGLGGALGIPFFLEPGFEFWESGVGLVSQHEGAAEDALGWRRFGRCGPPPAVTGPCDLAPLARDETDLSDDMVRSFRDRESHKGRTGLQRNFGYVDD
jgi:hypothetical protein